MFLLKKKSQTTQALVDFVESIKTKFNKKLQVFRSDRGGEYVNNELKDYLNAQGIKVQYTASYTPQQNGVAERKNRTLIEAVRTMLADACLPNQYWGEAVVTAAYIQNKLPTREREVTPYQLRHNKKPDLSFLKVFGCRAFAHVLKPKRKKLDAKARKCVMVGYSKESKAYRLLDRSNRKIIMSRDVQFIENERSGEKSEVTFDIAEQNVYSNKNNNQKFAREPIMTRSSEKTLKSQKLDQEIVYFPISDTEEINHNTQERKQNIENIAEESFDDDYYDPDTREDIVNVNKENLIAEDDSTTSSEDFQPANDTSEEPLSFADAITGPDAEKWISAMNEELDSLEDNENWDLEPIPRNKKPIGCK